MTAPVFQHHGERLLYRVEEAAQLLAIARCTVFDLIARGELESVKIGASRRISRTALERYITRLSDDAEGPDAA